MTRIRIPVRRCVVSRVSLLALFVLALLIGLGRTTPARAAASCEVSGDQTVCTFGGGISAVPGTSTWTVPAGVSSVTFDAIGSPGGLGGTFFGDPTTPSNGYGLDGLPGEVKATVPVTPGESFQITLGGLGGLPPCLFHTICAGGTGGAGGANGGAPGGDGRSILGYPGGGGGGASDVRAGLCASSASCGLGDRIIVAGGGGGGGGWSCVSLGASNGGAGGGPAGVAGTAGGCSDSGKGGDGGTGTAGGRGGAAGVASDNAGADGSLSQGGDGAPGSGPPNDGDAGGGGGGGYYGGGGGGDGNGSGGGGGGSSFGPPGATFASGVVHGGTGLVTITYKLADTTPPVITPPAPITANATSPSGTVVAYSVSATDPDDAVASLTCTPASGSTFPIGTTTVNCTATDTNGNSATASFGVHVEGAGEQLADLGRAVTGVGPGTSLADKVQQAQASMASNDLPDTCSTLTAFVNEVKAQAGKSIALDQALALIASANRIEAVLGC